ncbi:MAG: type IV secretion system DNA-binding domain-containing protein [Limisphaerales bacterium]
MARIDEQFTEQFRKWELRGRGWQVFDEPVQPEPPFVPFHGHYLPDVQPIDDGRRPTFLSSLVEKLSRKLSTAPVSTPVQPESEEEPEPQPLVREEQIEFQVSLPADLNIGKEAMEQFLRQLSLCQEPVAFELLGVKGRVNVQFAASIADARLVHRQLMAYFPDALFQTVEHSLETAWESCIGDEMLVVEFGLAREFMLPLASGKLDPFIGMIGALSELKANDLGLFQVIFQPVQNPWPESILNSVTDAVGKPFFVDAPELVGAAENKISHTLFAAVVRIAIKAETFERVLDIARDMASSLRVFAHHDGNELIPLQNDEYPFGEHVEDALRRQSRRCGMILNIEELIGFVHLPSSAIRTPALQRESGKTKAAPAIVRNPGILVGSNVHAGKSVEVRLSPEQRTRHCHIIGASGSGKSTLLFNLIKQDIENGQGIAVLDPHGDLIDRICGIIPESRINDVVLVDPSDSEYSVGFNILSAHSELEKDLLASDLVAVFERLSTSWGDQMNSVLQNAILAFLESDRRGTIADLRRFLIETPYRNEFLKSVKDSEVVYYWQKSFPLLSGNKSIGSILTRLDALLAKKPIRHMVSQPENKLDFAHIMDSGKIFLAKLPQGLIGRENSHLLGALLVSKFQQTVMSRQAQQIESRRDFWIYADEFANFITPSMAEILSGARKYRIGMTLAHHNLQQLQRDADVASAVMSHPFIRIVFRVGDDDARKLADGFSHFEATDLRNLEIGQAIVRVERSDFDFNLSMPLSEGANVTEAVALRQDVITQSRAKYATARADIDAMLSKPAVEPTATAPATPTPLAIIESITNENVEESASHSTIKESIGTEAEILDYEVTYEELFPEIQARADIVLRRGKQTIICQVSATTPAEFEADSVRKFLKAAVTQIAVISISRQKLGKIQNLLSEIERRTVGFYTSPEFIAKLQDMAADDPDGGMPEKGKPRKRKIDFASAQLTEEERKRREAEMLKSLARAMKGK